MAVAFECSCNTQRIRFMRHLKDVLIRNLFASAQGKSRTKTLKSTLIVNHDGFTLTHTKKYTQRPFLWKLSKLIVTKGESLTKRCSVKAWQIKVVYLRQEDKVEGHCADCITAPSHASTFTAKPQHLFLNSPFLRISAKPFHYFLTSLRNK